MNAARTGGRTLPAPVPLPAPLVSCRLPPSSSPSNDLEGPSDGSNANGDKLFEARIACQPDGQIGIALDKSNCVTGLRDGSPAADSRQVAVGDTVVAIEGVRCSTLEGRRACDVLQSLPMPEGGVYTFELRRGYHEPHPASSVESATLELREASMSGREGQVEALLNTVKGIDPNSLGPDDRVPPLCCAAAAGALGTVALLIGKKASATITNAYLSTPLHFAALNGHDRIISYLVEAHGAKLNAKNRFRDTPLHTAAKHGRAQACETLLALKADIGVKNKCGWTPLHLAAGMGHVDACSLLCCKGARPGAKGDSDAQPLHHAAAVGAIDVCRVLIDARALVHARSRHGSTALHFAAGNGHLATCELLLSAGAQLSCTDVGGCTPADWARNCGHAEVGSQIGGPITISATTHSPQRWGGERRSPLPHGHGHGAAPLRLTSRTTAQHI